MNTDIPTFRIPIEGERIDPVRDVKRIMVEVATDSTNGCNVGGGTTEASRGGHHRIPPPRIDEDGVIHPSIARFEIYTDNLEAVRSRVRTEEHLRILEAARETAKEMRLRWLNEEVRPAEQRRLKSMAASDGRGTRLDEVMRRCPHNEWTVLSEATSLRTGLPPLIYIKAVDRDGIAHDLGEFEKDPSRFLLDAPPTPVNATRLANEHLAATMADAITRVAGGSSSGEVAELRKLVEAQAAQIADLKASVERRSDRNR